MSRKTPSVAPHQKPRTRPRHQAVERVPALRVFSAGRLVLSLRDEAAVHRSERQAG